MQVRLLVSGVRGVAIGAVLLTWANALVAAEPPKVNWQTNPDTAWSETQKSHKPLLIVVTRSQCVPCNKLKQTTFTDPEVATKVSDSFTPLLLDASVDSPLLKELHVTAYPTTVIVSPEAVVLDRVVGFVEPKTMTQKLTAAQTTALASKPAAIRPAKTAPRIVPEAQPTTSKGRDL